jgi:hypothetical protein
MDPVVSVLPCARDKALASATGDLGCRAPIIPARTTPTFAQDGFRMAVLMGGGHPAPGG